ncbi:hypothetical protein ABT112_02580 [Streptomyces sp. NPDC002055]|uniref:hypothetical protein n=1 Tax=Streptomyces sp. NPDC002055 TaxID=3154534 RepID=UPI0033325FFE
MKSDVERLSTLAVEYRDIGCSVIEVAELMVEKHSRLRDSPMTLAKILRFAFPASVKELHFINAWILGEISREALEERISDG